MNLGQETQEGFELERPHRGKVLKSGPNMSSHLKMEAGKGRFKCCFCPHKFTTHTEMFRHKNICELRESAPRKRKAKVETTVRPNYKESESEDSENGSDFVDDSNEDQLNDNSLTTELINENHKPYPCRTCDRRFYSSKSLDGHRPMCSGTPLPYQREINRIADESESDSDSEDVDMTTPIGDVSESESDVVDMTAPIGDVSESESDVVDMTAPIGDVSESESDVVDMTAPVGVASDSDSDSEVADMTAPIGVASDSDSEVVDMTTPIGDVSESESNVGMTIPVVDISGDEDVALESYPSNAIPEIPQRITQEIFPTSNLNCPYCSKFLNDKESLLAHISPHIEERPYKCTHCPVRFKDMILLAKHQLNAHAQRRKIYRKKIQMNNSQAQASGSSSQMVKSAVKPTAIMPNNQARTSTSTFKPRSKSTSDTMNETLSDRTTSPSSKSRNVPSATSTLIVQTPPMTGTDTTCKLCSKVLASEKSLEDHIRLHTGEKPFVCQRCWHGYVGSKALGQHKRLSKSCGVMYVRKTKTRVKPTAVKKPNIGTIESQRRVDEDVDCEEDEEKMDSESDSESE